MPSAAVAPEAASERRGDRWTTAGLALIAVWCALFVVAIGLWVRVAFFPGRNDDPHGYIMLFGAPFVLVALGLLWWAWRSVRDLRRGRREGWTLLLVLGGVAVAQTVMTAPGIVGATAGPGTPGVDEASGPPSGMVTGMLAAIGLGLVSVVVAVLARRSWATADAAASADPAAGTGLSDRG
jgi:membrane protease YdiL (CAAX protease family)